MQQTEHYRYIRADLTRNDNKPDGLLLVVLFFLFLMAMNFVTRFFYLSFISFGMAILIKKKGFEISQVSIPAFILALSMCIFSKSTRGDGMAMIKPFTYPLCIITGYNLASSDSIQKAERQMIWILIALAAGAYGHFFLNMLNNLGKGESRNTIDFWTKSGYAGADPESSSSKDRITFTTRVKAVHLGGKAQERSAEEGLNGVDDAWKKMMAEGNGAYLELEELPRKENMYMEGLNMVFRTGNAKGATLLMDKMMRFSNQPGGILTIGACYGMSDIGETLAKVQPGDEILLDNSDNIAVQSYYRHQVPADLSFHAWDQFRDESGKPVTPQRPPFPMPFTGVGVPQDGNIQGKVINIQALMDESTCPWCADWWREKIIEATGSDQDHRTYFMERCMHGDTDARYNHMVVNYMGALRQALIDLSAWVEKGVEPLPRTAYTLGEDGQIHPEGNVEKRFGIQPIPTLTVNGSKRAQIKAGECARFAVDVEVPEGAGEVTEILFCPEGKHDVSVDEPWGIRLSFEKGERNGIHTAHAEYLTSYDKPGTYFAAVRVASNRHGNPDEIFTQVLNLDRARIIVS